MIIVWLSSVNVNHMLLLMLSISCLKTMFTIYQFQQYKKKILYNIRVTYCSQFEVGYQPNKTLCSPADHYGKFHKKNVLFFIETFPYLNIDKIVYFALFEDLIIATSQFNLISNFSISWSWWCNLSFHYWTVSTSHTMLKMLKHEQYLEHQKL